MKSWMKNRSKNLRFQSVILENSIRQVLNPFVREAITVQIEYLQCLIFHQQSHQQSRPIPVQFVTAEVTYIFLKIQTF